jgi:hypothetical protein
MEFTTEEKIVLKSSLEYRRDVVVRRLDTYRKMKEALDDQIYEHLVGMSEIELENILSAHYKII